MEFGKTEGQSASNGSAQSSKRGWKQFVTPPVNPAGGVVRVNATSFANFPLSQWGCYDLFFADPPYNIGVNYGSGSQADSTSDSVYRAFTENWIREAINGLRPGGALWILLPDEWAGVADYLCRFVIGGVELRNWIKWHETFGVQTKKKFARTSRHILYYTKTGSSDFVFNSDTVKVPSDRETKYKDPRAKSGGKVMGDVWTISRVAGTFNERTPEFKNQIPEELLRRIVQVSSNEGDKVLEFFSGSGSLARVCLELGRCYEGYECSARNAEKSYSRIMERGTEIRKRLAETLNDSV